MTEKTGIEPVPVVLKTNVLPLNYISVSYKTLKLQDLHLLWLLIQSRLKVYLKWLFNVFLGLNNIFTK